MNNTLRIRKTVYVRLNKIAQAQEMPTSELVNRILRDWLITQQKPSVRDFNAFESKEN